MHPSEKMSIDRVSRMDGSAVVPDPTDPIALPFPFLESAVPLDGEPDAPAFGSTWPLRTSGAR